MGRALQGACCFPAGTSHPLITHSLLLSCSLSGTHCSSSHLMDITAVLRSRIALAASCGALGLLWRLLAWGLRYHQLLPPGTQHTSSSRQGLLRLEVPRGLPWQRPLAAAAAAAREWTAQQQDSDMGLDAKKAALGMGMVAVVGWATRAWAVAVV